MQRVSVVGSSGAGKTTVGRALAEILGVPFTELDAVRHRPDWATIEPDEFTRRAEEVSQLDAGSSTATTRRS
jgi:shikimate kinase